jgi:hypothetical protein
MAMRAVLAVVVLAAFGLAQTGATRAEVMPQEHADHATAAPPLAGAADPMKMHARMMEDQKAATARLDALVTAMNAATAPAKADAVAAVVNELVRQQQAMHARMDEMHAAMPTMKH